MDGETFRNMEGAEPFCGMGGAGGCSHSSLMEADKYFGVWRAVAVTDIYEYGGTEPLRSMEGSDRCRHLGVWGCLKISKYGVAN